MKKPSDKPPPVPDKPPSLSSYQRPGKTPASSSGKPPPVPKKPASLSSRVIEREGSAGSSSSLFVVPDEPSSLSRPVVLVGTLAGSSSGRPPIPDKPRSLSHRIDPGKALAGASPSLVSNKPSSLSSLAVGAVTPAGPSSEPPPIPQKTSSISSRVVLGTSPPSVVTVKSTWPVRAPIPAPYPSSPSAPSAGDLHSRFTESKSLLFLFVTI
jgi:hypothetical protein